MYLADCLPATYYEEREAADAAKRLERLREQQKTQAEQQQQQPSQAVRPPSTGVLGNIFQSLVRAGVGQGASPSPCKTASSSGASTPAATTPPAKVMTQAEVEALMAEKKKDADIVGFRAW